jgi:hypothetical protein
MGCITKEKTAKSSDGFQPRNRSQATEETIGAGKKLITQQVLL